LNFFWIRIFHEESSNPLQYDLINITGFFPSLGIVAFASVCHDSSFLVYNTLRDHTVQRWNRLTRLALSYSSTICIIFGYAAFFTFTNEVDDNILNNYSDTDIVMMCTRIIYAVSMALSYPTAFYVVRHVVYAIFHRGPNYVSMQQASLTKHLLFTLPLWCLVLILSLVIKSLGIVMSVTGSIAAVNLAFVLPCACYLKTCKYEIAFWKNPEQQRMKAFKHIALPFTLVVLGILIAIVCSTYSLLQYFNVVS